MFRATFIDWHELNYCEKSLVNFHRDIAAGDGFYSMEPVSIPYQSMFRPPLPLAASTQPPELQQSPKPISSYYQLFSRTVLVTYGQPLSTSTSIVINMPLFSNLFLYVTWKLH
ncbi:hypothetical protein HK099_006870 [Clydaea vesicula]|uniref:Uncharacterized protein n=1 Tax=Clydaea vesicula TaxID=447962 RepID=A0AAD5U5R8_9FUNG|nr:hypothetical protein HK099_006870 [Clydaea vesicula]